jgi:hypothetical protein
LISFKKPEFFLLMQKVYRSERYPPQLQLLIMHHTRSPQQTTPANSGLYRTASFDLTVTIVKKEGRPFKLHRRHQQRPHTGTPGNDTTFVTGGNQSNKQVQRVLNAENASKTVLFGKNAANQKERKKEGKKAR